ncbi:hypothetical protein H4R18_002529 [Coemansia javaensis]|uniref:Hyaluronan/mRNA-binding protein domain-containing protein n=1 Tax=Coemansia javaensis TaxID=2761396 RepID=A0A9W8HGH0_9FUNG|nr:hypothetical protein H4R18_002529 [Coemansia javaensis]
MSAGALAKERHLARNGAGPRGSTKKEGSGRYNWGSDSAAVQDLEYEDDAGGVDDRQLNADPLAYAPAAQPKLAGRGEFDQARRTSEA